MLTHLHIQHYTLVDDLSLGIQSHMSAITGETGAGKSLIFDALDMCLGARADRHCVRVGQARADLCASFDIRYNPAARTWLSEHDLSLDDDEECLLRRTVDNDGRSRSFINGKPVPAQLTRELGSLLVSLHGQHEHQSLLKRDAQRDMLDTFARHDALLNDVLQAYESWRASLRELDALRSSEHNPAARELITYQLAELHALNLIEGECEQLNEEHRALGNVDDTVMRAARALSLLSSEDASDLSATLHQAISLLSTANTSTQHFAHIIDLLEQARIHLDEATPALQYEIDHLAADPERLAHIEQRLALLHDVARKHHVKPEQLIALQGELENQLTILEHSDTRITALETQLQQALTHYHEHADKLSQSRRTAAMALSTQVSASMHTLGLAGGQFTIAFNTLDDDTPRPYGHEGVEFMVCTNPGQALRPLQKVASGGELSRIALAIHVITANQSTPACLLFDEVDVGIGGATAHTVGRLLRELGEKTQVICVTHLAQVAAYAHHHYLVEKHHDDTHTQSQLRILDQTSRIDELARMMGAKTLSEKARKHAQELLHEVTCVTPG